MFPDASVIGKEMQNRREEAGRYPALRFKGTKRDERNPIR